eukprot:tig00021432_g21221.t1
MPGQQKKNGKTGVKATVQTAKAGRAVGRPDFNLDKTDLDKRYRLTQAEELKRLRVKCEDLERRAQYYARQMTDRQKIRLAKSHARALRTGEQEEDDDLGQPLHSDDDGPQAGSKKPLSPIKERHLDEDEVVGGEEGGRRRRSAPEKRAAKGGAPEVDFDVEMLEFENAQAGAGVRPRSAHRAPEEVPVTRPPFYVGRAPRRAFRPRVSPAVRVPPASGTQAAGAGEAAAGQQQQPKSYAGYLEVLMDGVARLAALVEQGAAKVDADAAARASLADSLAASARRLDALEAEVSRGREERDRLRSELQQQRLTSEVQVAALRSDLAIMQRLRPSALDAPAPAPAPPPLHTPSAPAPAPSASASATLAAATPQARLLSIPAPRPGRLPQRLLALPARGGAGRHDVSAWLDALEQRRPQLDGRAAPSPPATPAPATARSVAESAGTPATPLEEAVSTVTNLSAVEDWPRASAPRPAPAAAAVASCAPSTPPTAAVLVGEARRALWAGEGARRGAEAPPTVQKRGAAEEDSGPVALLSAKRGPRGGAGSPAAGAPRPAPHQPDGESMALSAHIPSPAGRLLL